MPTARPRYDGGGAWKTRQFGEDEWEAIGKRVREKLRRFYPDKNAKAEPPFEHPAYGWANGLLYEAENAVSMTLWLSRRLTNAELRAERDHALVTLKKADQCLSNLSHDLNIMLGVDADVLDCRDRIREIVPRLKAAAADIDRLPKAKKQKDAQHAAAVEMAIRLLRDLEACGVSTAATAGADARRPSAAVQILKIIGDEIGLILKEATWKGIIIKAKPSLAIRR